MRQTHEPPRLWWYRSRYHLVLRVFQGIGERVRCSGRRTEKVTIGKVLSHVRRLLSVDLSFPVILSADGRVMDGSHRIVAASVKGIEIIDVVQFNKNPMPGYTENLG